MTEQILAVQRMQDYIEEHLEEKIGIEELARVSLFSPWHSYRLFRSYIGLTPSEYIRRLRLWTSASAVWTDSQEPFTGNSRCVPAPTPLPLFPSPSLFLMVQNSEL